MGKFIDLTRQKFGRLTVIKRVENSKNGHSRWLCKCECGNPKDVIVFGLSLKSGNTQSCGCLAKEKLIERNKKYNTYDLTGEYGIGYTTNGEEFYFDLEDYDKVKNYCWYKHHSGYIVTCITDNDSEIRLYIQMHRLIMNCPDNMDIDHIFHNTYDNRKEFLRIVTYSQNSINQGIQSNNTSGITGVGWYQRSEKWRVRIDIDGKQINLGYFDDFNEAVKVRKEAELKYFGEYRYKK